MGLRKSLERLIDSNGWPYEGGVGAPVLDVMTVWIEPFQHVHGRVRDGVVDWWDKDLIQVRQKNLSEFGSAGMSSLFGEYQSRKGTIRTAELLYRAVEAGDERMARIVWIAAFIENVTRGRNLPDHWRGGPVFLMDEVADILGEMGAPRWHHAMRNLLPVDVACHLVAPGDVEDLVQCVWITAAACQSCFQFVVVRNKGKASLSVAGGEQ